MTDRVKLERILNTLKIPFIQQTGSGLNVCCPFCRRGDSKFHCGIFWDRKGFHCFKCEKTGSLFSLFHSIAGISFDDYNALTGLRYISTEEDTVANQIRNIFKKIKHAVGKRECICRKSIPGFLIDDDVVHKYPQLKSFLSRRNISVEKCKDYEARYTGYAGDYPYRLIVPIYNGKNLVSWQGRDVTNKARNKYQTAPGTKINDYLYWTDLIGHNPLIFVVEGVFDAWRLNENAVATFGHSLSKTQFGLLVNDKDIGRIVMAWDADAYNYSLETARSLALVRNGVGVVRLPEGNDPDSFGEKIKSLSIRWLS